MADDNGPVLPPVPEQRPGFLSRLTEGAFQFFLATPGRRQADYNRANLNVKILAALIFCLTVAWKYINSQQEAYERLVNKMIDQFANQNKEQLIALERLRLAQLEVAKEQRANTETIRDAFLVRSGKTPKRTTP